ncbi:MAG: outer membrane protein assembly factor, partial [Chitinophagia bacterium]|nr:outer membrane protein assembly factor [Chitinophagia bacterium]
MIGTSVSLPLLAQLKSGSGGLGSYRSTTTPDPSRPHEMEIGGITVSGSKFLDQELVIAVTNLSVGQKVTLPNDPALAKAIRNLWKQDLFANISINIVNTINDKLFLDIAVEERPRLGRYSFKNIKQAEAKELKTKIGLVANKIVTEATTKEAVVRIKKYYTDKGYGKTQVTVTQKADTGANNRIILAFIIDKGVKTHINEINISGVESTTDTRLKKAMKNTKENARLTLHPEDNNSVYPMPKRSFKKYVKNFGFLSISQTLDALEPYLRLKLFSGSKFNQQKYETDKQNIVTHLNTLGYRDAAIVADTVYTVRNGNLNIDIKVKEGHKYYFGDIQWRGNTKYPSDYLSKVLGIKRGDVYNQQMLDTRLGKQLSPDGGEDISSLYMDDGYLFFSIEPVETSVVGDTINYEMRIAEGTQATIRDITIFGNDRTNEHVIRRELRTLPGNKFSRSDLIRSQREIAQLGFFDQEKIGIQPKPHPEEGTVDIEYTVVEKSSDQLQLTAGFGGGIGFHGNVGISFNNFSMRNILKPKNWERLPVGDGQKFAINYASNGTYYNSLNTSFTEPWLGGKKPNSFTTNFIYSRYSGAAGIGLSANESYIRMTGG